MTRDELIEFVRDEYSGEPEYLWAALPDAFVFRHTGNRKWYAVVMEVERRRLGLGGEGSVDVLDVKVGPVAVGSFLGEPGVLPAYHMNKAHWISLMLDGTARDETIKLLLEVSYGLTGKTGGGSGGLS